MNLEIRSDTRLSFEIDHGDAQYFLQGVNGEWFLSDEEDGCKSLGSLKRVSWLGALRKALKTIGAYDSAIDGV